MPSLPRPLRTLAIALGGVALGHLTPQTGVTGLDPDAAPDARLWEVRQTLADPEGDGDWVIEATVDLDASDRVGEAVVLATALRRL